MKYSSLKFIICFYILLAQMVFSQSLGINFCSGYYYIYFQRPEFTTRYVNLPVKEVLLNYNHEIVNNLQLSFMVGYGWMEYNSLDTYVANNNTYLHKSDSKSNGIPIVLQLKYHNYINADSIFEPFIGLGVGYCNFKSKLTNRYDESLFESEFDTKGFSQFVSLGINLHISKKIISFIELKKMILNQIEITGDLEALTQTNNQWTFSEDYTSSADSFDIGIQIGFFYNL